MTYRRPPRPWVALALAVVIILAIVVTDQATSATKPPAKKATVVFGKAQAEAHKAAVTKPPIVPFIRTLSVGMKGCKCPTVFQLQRALKAAHVRPAKVKSTGYYGVQTGKEVAAFQRAHHIKPVTGRYGVKTHKALTKYYDKQGRQRLIAVAQSRKLSARLAAFVTVTTHARVVGGNTLTYSQSGSRGYLPAYPRLPPATDCSGYVTWVFHSVGLSDPNGFGYSPVGWTGTLAKHGVVVSASKVRIGDLVFYGGGYPFGHVTVYVGHGMVSSHGSRGIKLVPITYRPVSQVRRYF